MSDWQHIQQWLKNLGYEKYIPIFEKNGFDDWEIIEDLTLSDLIDDLNIPKGHSKKILKHKYNNKKLNSNNTSFTSYQPIQSTTKTKSDESLFESLMSMKSKQKAKYMKYLEENKFIHKKPNYLHPKCKTAYYTPRKTTQQLSIKNQMYNVHVLNINEEADLQKSHWNATIIRIEAEFRTNIEQEKNKIDALLKSINFNINLNSVYSVQKDTNSQTNINKNAKDIMKDKQKLSMTCTQLTQLVNNTQHHMKNKLKIIDANDKPITYKSTKGSFWTTKQIDQIKDKKVLEYHKQNINNFEKQIIKLKQRINEINTDKYYQDIAARSSKKLKANEAARIKMNVRNRNGKYRLNTTQNIMRMQNTNKNKKLNNKNSSIKTILFSFVENTSQVLWHKNGKKRKYKNEIIINICKYLTKNDTIQMKLSCKALNKYFIFVQQIPYVLVIIDKENTNTFYRLGIFTFNKYDPKKKEKFDAFQYKLKAKSLKYTKLCESIDYNDPPIHWVPEKSQNNMLTIRQFKSH